MKKIDRILGKWGEDISVTENRKTVNARALIQPMHRRYKTYFSGERLPSGILDNSHFFMIASPTLELSAQGSAVVQTENNSYLIRSCGEFKVKEERLYVWAVLAARTEPVEDDYD